MASTRSRRRSKTSVTGATSRASSSSPPDEHADLRGSDPRFESDGLRLINVVSPSLRGRADITLAPGPPGAGRPRGLVVLLHGIRGSHWSWTHQGGIHHTLRHLTESHGIPPLAVVMPSDGLWGDGSGYLPHHDIDFDRWIIHEIPAVAREVAGIDDSAPVFLGGLSMGGYGALRLGFGHPNRVAGVNTHSAITKLEDFAPYGGRLPTPADTGDNLRNIADLLSAPEPARRPALRLDCGRDDPLITANRQLHQDLLNAGIEHQYEEPPGGHNWAYWSKPITATLRWFGELT